jgi:hypothetical protein
MSLGTVFLLVFAAAVINWLAGAAKLHGFLWHTSAIASPADLEKFKGLVRTQMHQALLQMGLLTGLLLLGLAGLVSGRFGLVHVVTLNGVILGLGLLAKGLETRARTLPVQDSSLAEEYKRVCHAWLKKALPDF